MDFLALIEKTSSKDKQVASSMSSGSYGGYIDAGESRGFVSPEQADKMIKNPEAYKMRPSETRYLRESMGLPRAQFFSPSGNEIGQIASATTDLSGLSNEENYRAYMKEQGIRYPRTLSPMFHRLNKENMMQDIQEGKFKDGQFLNQAPVDTDTEIAGAFGMSDDEIERRKNLNEIINTPGYDPQSVTEAQRQLIRLNQGLSPFDKKVEAPKENILQKVGGFFS